MAGKREIAGITLITGATGRVGGALARHLLHAGKEVRALVLPGDPGGEALASDGADVCEGLLENYDDVVRCVRGVSQIVHLGSRMSWAAADEQAIFEGNVRGTYNLLAVATDELPRVQSVIFASSDDTYPSIESHGQLLDEARPLMPTNPYALSKELGERMCLFRWRSARLPVTVVRFSVVATAEEALRPSGWSGRFLFAEGWQEYFEATGRPDLAARILERASDPARTAVVLRGENREPYVLHIADVRDICEALTLILEQPAVAAGEVFNLAGPAPFALDEAAVALRDKGGFESCEVDLPGAPVAIRLDIKKARSVLGYRPQWSIHAIIEDACAMRV